MSMPPQETFDAQSCMINRHSGQDENMTVICDDVGHQHRNVLRQVADHFSARAGGYSEKYAAAQPRHLFEHEKRQRAALTHTWIRAYARQVSQGQLLDVGCGDGRNICQVLAAHARWRAVGVDLSCAMIEQARRVAARGQVADRAQWTVGSVDALNGAFDVVTALGVVGYQADQLAFLESLAARVVPNGLLIFTYANALSVPRRVRSIVQNARRFGADKNDAVRFRTITVRQLDDCLAIKMFSRIHLCWLCFGIGLPDSRHEVELSRWMERRWNAAPWSRFIAQVGLACYRRIAEL